MPNDDLISRKNTIAEIKRVYCADCNNYNGIRCRACNFSDSIDIIEDASTVDAEPVRHGKWIETYAYGAWHYDCPFCDDGYATKEREKKPANFCSNCGAKMDKEEDTPCTQQ